MNAPLTTKPMTVDEFIPWAMAQPRGRFELLNGEVVTMSPERVRHTQSKGLVFIALHRAIEQGKVSCQCLTDGTTVRIDEQTAYEPDAVVIYSDRINPDDLEIDSPVVVVEVVSPSSRAIDTGLKFRGYFSLPTVVHYLIVDPIHAAVIHHQRLQDGIVASETVTTGVLRLDPPGLIIPVTNFFPPA